MSINKILRYEIQFTTITIQYNLPFKLDCLRFVLRSRGFVVRF